MARSNIFKVSVRKESKKTAQARVNAEQDIYTLPDDLPTESALNHHIVRSNGDGSFDLFPDRYAEPIDADHAVFVRLNLIDAECPPITLDAFKNQRDHDSFGIRAVALLRQALQIQRSLKPSSIKADVIADNLPHLHFTNKWDYSPAMGGDPALAMKGKMASTLVNISAAIMVKSNESNSQYVSVPRLLESFGCLMADVAETRKGEGNINVPVTYALRYSKADVTAKGALTNVIQTEREKRRTSLASKERATDTAKATASK